MLKKLKRATDVLKYNIQNGVGGGTKINLMIIIIGLMLDYLIAV